MSGPDLFQTTPIAVDESGLDSRIKTFAALVSMSPNFDLGMHYISQMRSSGLKPTLTIWTYQIMNAKSYYEASLVANEIRNQKLALDAGAYAAWMKVCETKVLAEQVFRSMLLAEVTPSALHFNILIEKTPRLEAAIEHFNSMLDQDIQPNVASYQLLILKIHSFIPQRRLLEDMLDRGLKPNLSIYMKILHYVPDSDTAMVLIQEMKEYHIEPTTECYALAVRAAGDYESAREVMSNFAANGVQPNEIFYTTLALVAPDIKTALEIFVEMLQEGIQPQAVFFRALRNKGLTISLAEDLLEVLKAHTKIGISSDVYCVILETCSNTDETARILNLMNQNNIRLGYTAYRSLFKTCPNWNTALKYRQHLLKRGFTIGLDIYALMFELAPSSEVAKIIKLIEKSGLKPDSRCFGAMIRSSRRPDEIDYYLSLMKKYNVVPNDTTYLDLLSKAKTFDQAVSIFSRINRDEIVPGAIHYSAVLSRATTFSEGFYVCKEMLKADELTSYALTHLARLVDVKTNLLDFFAFMSELEDMQFKTNIETWNALLGRFLLREEANVALQKMKEFNLTPNSRTYSQLLQLDGNLSQLPNYLREMEANGVTMDIYLLNLILKLSGNLEAALHLVNNVKSTGLAPDHSTIKILLGLCDSVDSGLHLISTFRNEGITPTLRIFKRVVPLCKNYNELIKVLTQILEYQITMDLSIFISMARTPMSRAEAVQFVQYGCESGYLSSYRVFTSLFSGAKNVADLTYYLKNLLYYTDSSIESVFGEYSSRYEALSHLPPPSKHSFLNDFKQEITSFGSRAMIPLSLMSPEQQDALERRIQTRLNEHAQASWKPHYHQPL